VSVYALARPLLFSLDPETAHSVTLRLAHFAPAAKVPSRPVKAMGLEFANPVGMAAGLDKHAEHVDALAALGFGFLELGGVVPRPQPGNPPPRLFRLTGPRAIINRFGLNSIGVDAFAENLKRARTRSVIGVNISKNKDTPNERAVEDYLRCLEVLFPLASYLSINVSSPNTQGLRDLQQEQFLASLLRAMRERRDALRESHGRHVALAPKISPDLDEAGIRLLADIAVRSGMDGIIATNTTVSREGLNGERHAGEAGGLSGAPLRARSTEVVRQLSRHLRGALPIVGVGGIMSRADALEKFEAGATLVQVYTGLVYRGPELIAECVP
jgi:dihydroorotate dehydrogenase